ncbi:MAG: hypothetical protein WCH21_11435 [Bacteroidota bacterium]
MEITVNYYNVELRCEFDLNEYSPQTNEDPAEGGEFVDLAIYIQETEMSNILTKHQIDLIKELIFEQL